MVIPVKHFEVVTKTPTVTLSEGLQGQGWGVKSLSTLCQVAFLTCNIGPLPLGVLLSPTSESGLLSEPPFPAEWQGGPVQPVPGRGARGPQRTWQVRVSEWTSGLEDKLSMDNGAIS